METLDIGNKMDLLTVKEISEKFNIPITTLNKRIRAEGMICRKIAGAMVLTSAQVKRAIKPRKMGRPKKIKKLLKRA